MGDITENFSNHEFLKSDSFPDVAKGMFLTSYDKDVIKLGCESILQPLRNEYGQLNIESGKRSIILNGLVGGSNDSDHLGANAVDLTQKYLTCEELFMEIKASNLPYRQIIIYDDQNIVHVSWNIPGKEYKHEALIKTNGTYKFA